MSSPTTATQFTFAGGILDIGLRNRIDLQKRDSGVADALNAIVRTNGGLMKRGGFRFINRALHDDKPIRLVEFEFSTDQTYMLEFGDGTMRFYTDDGIVLNASNTPYQIATPYSSAQAQEFRYVQSRDAMFYAMWDVTPQRLVRHGHTDWRWASMFADATRIQSPGGLRFYNDTSNGHNDYEYAVTAYRQVSGNRQESIGYQTLQSLSSQAKTISEAPQKNVYSCLAWYDKYSQISEYTKEPKFPAEPHQFFRLDVVGQSKRPRYYDNVTSNLGDIPTSTISPDLVGWAKYHFTDNPPLKASGSTFNDYEQMSIASDGTHIGTFYNSDYPGMSERYGGFYVTWYLRDVICPAVINSDKVCYHFTIENGFYNFPEQGLQLSRDIYNPIINFINDYNARNGVKATNRIAWNAVSGAAGYYVYRRPVNGDDRTFRLIGDVTTTNFLDDIGTTIPGTRSPVVGENTFTNPGDYPAVVRFFEQRLLYGRTKNKPASIFGSHVGIYTDFSIDPTDDSSGYEFELASQKLNAIEEILTLRNMFILTSGGEFVATGGGAAITSRNITVREQSQSGASSVPPITVDDTALYVPRSQQTIKTFSYTLEKEAYSGQNLLQYALNLITGKRIVDIAFQRDPHNLLWVVLDDGALLSCTLLPDEQFLAWTRHETQGKVQSIATKMTSDGTDQLWAVIRRDLPDGTSRQYIEVLEDILPYESEPEIASAFCVDSGLSGEFDAPVTQVGGLSHLEGLTVSILADGNVMPPQVVANGRITIDRPAFKVHVGLPYEFYVKTLDLELIGQGTFRNATRQLWQVIVELFVTRELEYRAEDGQWWELPVQDGQTLGLVPKFMDGDRRLNFGSYDTSSTTLELRSRSPVPVCLLSLVAETEHGDP